MTDAALVPIVVIAIILTVDGWVYVDATRRAEAGRPVVFRAGSLVIDTPTLWFLACLILWVIFLPLYVTSRS